MSELVVGEAVEFEIGTVRGNGVTTGSPQTPSWKDNIAPKLATLSRKFLMPLLVPREVVE